MAGGVAWPLHGSASLPRVARGWAPVVQTDPPGATAVGC
jgi:hypothetical protein